MSSYGEYLEAMRNSGNPEQFAREYISPTEQAAYAAKQEMPKTQTHNVAPVTRGNTGALKSDLRNYVAPAGNVNRESQYYKAGEKARAAGTNMFGAGGTFGTKPKAAPVFEDLIKDAPSADEVDNAAMKSHQYYRTQVESMLGHPVNALSDEQVKQIYIDKTGDESPYLNTGSDNPFYTPAMAAIDNAAAMTSGDFPYSSQEESERTRDSSAYWDANRPEVHNAKPLPPKDVKMETSPGEVLRNGWNALFHYNGEPTAASAERPPIEYGDEYARPNNYGYYYDGRSGNRYPTPYQDYLAEMEQAQKQALSDTELSRIERGAVENGANWATARDREATVTTSPREERLSNPEFERRMNDGLNHGVPLDMLMMQELRNNGQTDYYWYLASKRQ